jgi:hypothetical protein
MTQSGINCEDLIIQSFFSFSLFTVERPNLGCRVLIHRNLSKIVGGLMRDIVDWVASTRLKSASLLYVLLLNAEDYITQHMTPLISGMNKACADSETQVVKDVGSHFFPLFEHVNKDI